MKQLAHSPAGKISSSRFASPPSAWERSTRIDLAIAPREGPRRRDAGGAPADHDHVRRDLHVRGRERAVEPDAREPRRDEPARALRRRRRISADPLDLLAQVHQLQVIGRAARRGEHPAERRLVLARGAGADDDALEPAIADPRRQPGLPLRRAEHVVDRDVARPWPRGRIAERAQLHHLTEVRTAAAEEDAGGAVFPVGVASVGPGLRRASAQARDLPVRRETATRTALDWFTV